MKAVLIMGEDGSLIGATPEEDKYWQAFQRKLMRMKPGQAIRLEWSGARSVKHHRKLFALLQLISQNSELYDTTEKALVAVKLAAGYFDVHINPVSGAVEQVPLSIGFEAMEQSEFNRFFNSAVHAVTKSILPTMDYQTALYLLEKIVEGWTSHVPDC